MRLGEPPHNIVSLDVVCRAARQVDHGSVVQVHLTQDDADAGLVEAMAAAIAARQVTGADEQAGVALDAHAPGVKGTGQPRLYQQLTGESETKTGVERGLVTVVYNGISHGSGASHRSVCWLLNLPATCKCISGTDLLRQFYVLPH